MSERLKLYRVTATVEYEYMVAAASEEEAESADVDLRDFWDVDPWVTAVEVTDVAGLGEWADDEPYGDDDRIAGRTCAEILEDEEDREPTDRKLEAAGQLTLIGGLA